jgi:mRNA-degrading endonuclease toxin of MazEF toxin-antitoxin module
MIFHLQEMLDSVVTINRRKGCIAISPASYNRYTGATLLATTVSSAARGAMTSWTSEESYYTRKWLSHNSHITKGS